MECGKLGGELTNKHGRVVYQPFFNMFQAELPTLINSPRLALGELNGYFGGWWQIYASHCLHSKYLHLFLVLKCVTDYIQDARALHYGLILDCHMLPAYF